MKEKLEAIKAQALAKIDEAKDLDALNDIKVAVLGKKGCGSGGASDGWTDG